MDKYQKRKIWRPRNKIKISPNVHMNHLEDQLNNDKDTIFQKLILKLRNKIKNSLLTFLNGKKYFL